jgi:hypothetical protein
VVLPRDADRNAAREHVAWYVCIYQAPRSAPPPSHRKMEKHKSDSVQDKIKCNCYMQCSSAVAWLDLHTSVVVAHAFPCPR